MEAFASYLLKSALWLSGFAVIYFLFLRNERYFMLKRIYLISGMLIAFLFPLISVHYNVELQAPGQPMAQEFSNAAGSIITTGVQQEKAFHPDYRLIILFIYLAGILYLLLRSIGNFTGIFRAIRGSEVTDKGKVRIIKATQFRSSFSFFNYVFINPSIGEVEAAEIMNHEIVHVRQRHWFDLLLVEILRMVQWVNPFAWIYTGFIRLNHEYLADQAALQRSVSPANYRAALMNQLFDAPVISLSNSFNYSLNKKRFDMMKQKITSPWRKTKVLFILPVIALLLYAFATPRYVYSEQINTRGISGNNTNRGKISDTIAINQNVLILVDGVKMNKDAFGAINPDNIRTIDVLKGDAAIAAYGDKGKNGVMVVTLKPEAKLANLQDTTKPKAPQKTSVTFSPAPPPPPPPYKATNAKGETEFAIVMEQPLSGQQDTTKGKSPNKISVVRDKDNMLVIVDGKPTDKTPSQVMKELAHDLGTVRGLSQEEGFKAYGEKGKNGVIEFITRKKALEMGLKVSYRRTDPEDFPTFQGGKPGSFTDWVISQLKYPEDALSRGISGTSRVSFSIAPDGTFLNPRLFGSTDKSLDDAMLKAVASSPKWEPAKNAEARDTFTTVISLRFEIPDKIFVPIEPFVVVEEQPMFPGGEEALLNFIANNIKYPETAKKNLISGRVIVRFVVGSDGKVDQISVMRGVNPALDAEAIRVVSTLPQFKPGYQGGKPVPVWYMVPVTFSLTEQKPAVSGSSPAEIRK